MATNEAEDSSFAIRGRRILTPDIGCDARQHEASICDVVRRPPSLRVAPEMPELVRVMRNSS